MDLAGERANDRCFVAMHVGNADAVFLEQAADLARCRNGGSDARRHDLGIDAKEPGLGGELTVVKDDQERGNATVGEPSDQAQNVALDAAKEFSDRADRNAVERLYRFRCG